MERNQQIQAAIEAHITGTGDSQNQLAFKIGVSPATLSNIRAGKWASIAPAMWNKIATFLGVQDEAWPLFETPNYRRVMKVCDDAQQQHKMLGISDYTGGGKSTALRTYAKTNPASYYVLCTTVMGRRQFVGAILQSMGLPDAGNIAAGIEAITERLNEVGTGLLILDDAGKLSDQNLLLVQVIYDQTEFQAGIVLAGTEYLKKYIDKMAGKDKRGFRELQRRVQFWQNLARPSQAVIVQIAKAHGIEDSSAHTYLARVAKDYGTLRNMIINGKMAVASRPNMVITAELLAGLQVGDHNYHSA
jgi:DNA transposition AAA+ family ATPase